jgi:hypothetical protein
MVTIDHLLVSNRTCVAMKIDPKDALVVRWPHCYAKPGERERTQHRAARIEPHRDRRLAASETRKNE